MIWRWQWRVQNKWLDITKCLEVGFGNERNRQLETTIIYFFFSEHFHELLHSCLQRNDGTLSCSLHLGFHCCFLTNLNVSYSTTTTSASSPAWQMVQSDHQRTIIKGLHHSHAYRNYVQTVYTHYPVSPKNQDTLTCPKLCQILVKVFKLSLNLLLNKTFLSDYL